ncbi:hypothetical protein PMIN07_002506 [Paraphaeosphaeria minitans]
MDVSRRVFGHNTADRGKGPLPTVYGTVIPHSEYHAQSLEAVAAPVSIANIFSGSASRASFHASNPTRAKRPTNLAESTQRLTSPQSPAACRCPGTAGDDIAVWPVNLHED